VTEDVDAATTAGAGTAAPLITVSATYGSGGSIVAPGLAERLGVRCLQRITSPGSAATQAVLSRERLSQEEAKSTPVHRLVASLSHAMPAGPTQSPPPPHHQHRDLRRDAEAEVHSLAAEGEGVILGRAAAVVLGKELGFHVRLDGPEDRRLAQGARIEGVTVREARDHMRIADKARTAYVRRLYGVDPADPSLYHLVIDSTAIPIDDVIELILAAAGSAAQRKSAD
jgi:cytidylate kinase